MRLEDGTEQTVDRQTLDESPYRVGEEITEEQWEALLELSQYNRARERALYAQVKEKAEMRFGRKPKHCCIRH